MEKRKDKQRYFEVKQIGDIFYCDTRRDGRKRRRLPSRTTVEGWQGQRQVV